MSTEGYIGFTSKTVKERYRGHLKESRSSRCPNYPIYNNIKKYGKKILVTTVVEADVDYCLYIEEKLRPDFKIGWNLQIGGNKGGYGRLMSAEARKKISDHVKSRVVSEETRKRMSEASSGRKASDELRAKMSRDRLGKPRTAESVLKQSETLRNNPWRACKGSLEQWADAEYLFHTYHLDTETYWSPYVFARLLGRPAEKLKVIYRKLTDGWNPSEDIEYLKWLSVYKEQNEKQ